MGIHGETPALPIASLNKMWKQVFFTVFLFYCFVCVSYKIQWNHKSSYRFIVKWSHSHVKSAKKWRVPLRIANTKRNETLFFVFFLFFVLLSSRRCKAVTWALGIKYGKLIWNSSSYSHLIKSTSRQKGIKWKEKEEKQKNEYKTIPTV